MIRTYEVVLDAIDKTAAIYRVHVKFQNYSREAAEEIALSIFKNYRVVFVLAGNRESETTSSEK